jgi:hypothetical protein
MLVESVGKQVADFAERIDEEGITDTTELNSFSKLCNTYNRLLERAGKSRPKSKDNGFPDDEMDDLQFIAEYYSGNPEFRRIMEERFEAGYGCPFHSRLVLLPETFRYRGVKEMETVGVEYEEFKGGPGGEIIFEPGAPHFEHNLRVLAKSNPNHRMVRKYGRLIAEGKLEGPQLLDGVEQEDDSQFFSDPNLTQEDVDAVEEMLAMAKEDDPEFEPEYKSNDEIERAFADGKI